MYSVIEYGYGSWIACENWLGKLKYLGLSKATSKSTYD